MMPENSALSYYLIPLPTPVSPRWGKVRMGVIRPPTSVLPHNGGRKLFREANSEERF